MAADRSTAELERFLAERADHLLRTAVLLTCSREAGEDLLQTAVERLLRRWRAIYALTQHWSVQIPPQALYGGVGAALAIGAIAGLYRRCGPPASPRPRRCARCDAYPERVVADQAVAMPRLQSIRRRRIPGPDRGHGRHHRRHGRAPPGGRPRRQRLRRELMHVARRLFDIAESAEACPDQF
jgi:hypothetical protein